MLSNVNKTVSPVQQHEGERQSLLTHLLDAVKQCQIRFGGKRELATESDSRVCCLCACWEAVLQHGLRHTNKALSTIKQVTEMTGLAKIGSGIGLLEDIKNMETEPAFWQCVKPLLTPHETERYLGLQHISTEEGRGRAWLRAAISEHSMERYMHTLVENTQHLSMFYEEWAFLRDHEKSSVLPNMARGLNSILFAINMDNADLNSIKPATGLDNLVSLTTPVGSMPLASIPEPEPQPVIGGETLDREKRKEKKKRKKPAKIVSFDGDDSSYSGSPMSSIASPLSKSCSFDLTSPSAIAVGQNPPRTGFVFPSLAMETSRSDSGDTGKSSAKSDSESEKSAASDSPREGAEVSREQDRSQQRKQKFPGVNDVLSVSDVKTWQDVLGIDSVSDNKSRDCEPLGTAKDNGGNDELLGRKNQNPGATANVDGSSEVSLAKTDEEKSEASKTVTLGNESQGLNLNSTHAEAISKPNELSSLFKPNELSSLEIKAEIHNNPQDRAAETVTFSLDTSDDSESSFNDTRGKGTAGNKDTTVKDPVVKDSAFKDPVVKDSAFKDTANVTVTRTPTATIKMAGAFEEVASSKASADKPSHVNRSVSKSSLPGVRSEPVLVEAEVEVDPARVRTLPSGNSVDNADAQSNLSFGSVSSAGGDAFLRTVTSDVHMVPMNAEGKMEFMDVVNDSGSTTESIDSYGVYNEATESAMKAVAIAQKGYLSSLRTQGDGSNAPTPVINTQDSMTTGELKQAVIAMMMRKDEVEEHNKSLRGMLEEEQERVAALKAEMEDQRARQRSMHDRDQDTIRDITRENELLKHQLRKYVSAVQMLRSKGASDEEFGGLHLDAVQPSIPPAQPRGYSHEAGEYEKKLVQVAEMHGELIELNERLQKTVQLKDGVIKRMKTELEDLRGPLPTDLQTGDDTSSIHSEMSEMNSRALINVWIPSAFLRGTSKETYHVYQVYIRIRDEEWNVYRRYTEFREMHTKLKKSFPAVSALDFPPKKSIGSKDARFVEQRRKKLQIYLRKMLNMLAQKNPELCTQGCKQRLIAMLPLFGNQPVADKKTKKRERSRSRGRNGASSNPVQVYDGL